MAQTVIRGTQILNNTVQRQDLDTSTVGQAVVTKLVQGSNISLSSTGADSGTGDVTVSHPIVVSTDAGNIATLGSDSQILVPQSQIWSVRLRSFNALSASNPTFEVDQRTVGSGTNVNNSFALDRWLLLGLGTMAGLAKQQSGNIVVPGTNFAISQNFLRVTVNTVQAVLGAGDYYQFQHVVEGPNLRELISDVHSISVLVRSSVSGLKFGLALRNSAGTYYLTKLCTIPSANVWTLIQLPNIPVWTGSGVWNLGAGSVGYYLHLVLACGATNTSPINDTWQSGALVGAAGQSNFFANPVNSTFDLAFISHEPGSQCSNPPIDCPFTQNLDDCLRYFQKSYDYQTALGTSGSPNGFISGTIAVAPSNTWIVGLPAFPKAMAKDPTVTPYNTSTGAANTVNNSTAGTSLTVASLSAAQKGISGISVSTAQTAGSWMNLHYSADTGW